MHGLGAGSLHFAGMLPSCCGFFSRAGVWEPDPLIRVAVMKAGLQNSHGGPVPVGRTLLLWGSWPLESRSKSR